MPKKNIPLLKRLRTRFLRMKHRKHFNMQFVAAANEVWHGHVYRGTDSSPNGSSGAVNGIGVLRQGLQSFPRFLTHDSKASRKTNREADLRRVDRPMPEDDLSQDSEFERVWGRLGWLVRDEDSKLAAEFFFRLGRTMPIAVPESIQTSEEVAARL